MTAASWSRWDAQDCLRVTGLAVDAAVHIRPVLTGAVGNLPPTAGRLVRDGGDVCFVPRFPFTDGTTYAVLVDGVEAAALLRPRPDRPATTVVLVIHPTSSAVPRNLLRLYVRFSAPMSEGGAAEHLRLLDDGDEPMVGALLPARHELWDPDRRRLTVLLDPGRIKRGLVPHREAGYPLNPGRTFRFVVDGGFRDALGLPLRTPAVRRYEVGGDERRHVDPKSWVLARPGRGTFEPLEVTFDRPLDHGLLARCLRIVGPDGHDVDGEPETGPEERSWRLTPRRRWTEGPHQLVVDPVLEDLAGNSVSRVFDRDLTRGADDPRPAQAVGVPFHPQ